MPPTPFSRPRPAPLAAPPVRLLLLGLCVLFASACASTGTYVAGAYQDEPVPPLPADEVAHTVFLTGNTGDLDTGAVLRALGADARGRGGAATVAFLGDVTTDGVPAAGAGDRAEALDKLDALADALGAFEGEVVVVPGDRDWRQGENGVRRLETVVDSLFGGDALVPGDQSGGPREWEPAEGLRLVALDTGWWLLDADARPPGEAEGQDVRTPGDVARILRQIVVDRDDSRIVVLAHHPLASRGEHAGYRTVGQTLATLGIGALAARTFGRDRQDLASPEYRAMRAVLEASTAGHDRLVWAASHDHSLQTLPTDRSVTVRQFNLVSGTGGGAVDPVSSEGALHVAARPGYQRLLYYPDGRLWTETVEVDPETGAAEVAFRTELAGPIPELVDPEVPTDVEAEELPETLGETVVAELDAGFSQSPRFSDGAVARTLFGDRYRDAWHTRVEVPVVDMGTEAGGLTPIKRSGGNQTTGLRLESGDGHVYDFRLLEKGGTGQVPADLRDGLVSDVVLELRAAAIPYGAIVTAELSNAVGVPTPRPRIVYVPDDPRLGRYRDQFGDRLATLELRPDDDVSDVPEFEGFTDVISDEKLREELREDQDHYVDQRAFLRARLVDMLVADWDRHAGQFRWGAFEPGELDSTLTGDAATKGKVYLPVPRDHDWAFYGIGGLLQPALFSFDDRLQGIGESYGSIAGLTRNGFDQDRRFLNALTREDWEAIARDVQAALSDTVIARSLDVLPAPVYDELAPGWERALEGRRDRLVDLARRYYDIQARIVDVLGSDEREAFEIERLADGRLRVTVRSYKGGEVGRELYARTFSPDETVQVRLYGMAGDDLFRVVGDGPDDIGLRIIGGAGDDVVDAPAGHLALYDTPGGAVFEARGPGVKDRRSEDADVNLYDPTERVRGMRRVFPDVGYQSTDGVILGAGITWSVPGFRLRPYAAVHSVSANIATATGGVAARYTGYMRHVIGPLSLTLDAQASTPRYARNFYGFGNGTADVGSDLARVNLARAQVRAGLGTPLGQGALVSFGPSVRYADASAPDLDDLDLDLGFDRPNGTVVLPAPPALALGADAFDPQTHAGAFGRFEVAALDRAVNPRQGVRIAVEGDVLAGLTGPAETYGAVLGEIAAYVPVAAAPQVTLALRGGAETRVGDFPFYDAAVIGGLGTLRGYRRERFSGRTAASASAEVRAALFDVSTYVLPVQVGVLGFVDGGRVWADTPECTDALSPEACALVDFQGVDPDAGDGLQFGYGGGLWFGFLDRAVANVTVGVSDESTLVSVGLGFAY
ncbi:BamA/TamA family outer membrane protein [Rubrivirga litoralis]|uniref:BamA/TamA family outer membrane protein n=1 Tax=Rubrivirga litoralis TaxID=3075598 RepID=A0ABU3BQ05_9BACT|nr:BamA/TamA family outer membrane protein [Rubrivirga sp. F394]MDT0631281.1 BamA/TamA family outer membrane protein [Rubrivirga sp. F394]